LLQFVVVVVVSMQKGKPADEVKRGHKLSFPLMQWLVENDVD